MNRLARHGLATIVCIAMLVSCSCFQVFTTGNEQALIELAAVFSPRNPIEGGPFRNSVDQAIATLRAKAYPRPQRRTLADGVMQSLRTEYFRQTQKEVPAPTMSACLEKLEQGPAFDTVLCEMDVAAGKPLDRARLVQAGLEGAVQSSGCPFACVLTQQQASELEKMMKNRRTPGTAEDAAAKMILTKYPEPGILRLVIPLFEGSGIAKRASKLVQDALAAGAKTVILDIRDNPGGRPEEANGVADIFLDRNVLQIFDFHNGRRLVFRSKSGDLGPRVIVLTNRNTGSAAEMLAMALQDNRRAIVVGEKTAGALSGKDISKLMGGETIFFRVAPTILSPNGTDYCNQGICPEVAVADVRKKNKDAVLQRAINLAKQSTRQ